MICHLFAGVKVPNFNIQASGVADTWILLWAVMGMCHNIFLGEKMFTCTSLWLSKKRLDVFVGPRKPNRNQYSDMTWSHYKLQIKCPSWTKIAELPGSFRSVLRRNDLRMSWRSMNVFWKLCRLPMCHRLRCLWNLNRRKGGRLQENSPKIIPSWEFTYPGSLPNTLESMLFRTSRERWDMDEPFPGG